MESCSFFDARFVTVVEDALKFYHCPGLSITVVHKGTTYAEVGHFTMFSIVPAQVYSKATDAVLRVMALQISHLKQQ